MPLRRLVQSDRVGCQAALDPELHANDGHEEGQLEPARSPTAASVGLLEFGHIICAVLAWRHAAMLSRTKIPRSCRHLATGKVSSAYESLTKNWGESVTLRPDGMRFAVPSDLAELQEVVRSASAVRVVGSAHSFNDISVSDLHDKEPLKG